MPSWLYETASASSGGVVGFGVLDALGMRLGTVEGWVWSPDGRLAFLDLAHRMVLRESRHLVPLGYVVQVDPGRRYVHLRDVTRRTLGTLGLRFDHLHLPDPDALSGALAAAPAARGDVSTLLRSPAQSIGAFLPERVVVRQSGDPVRSSALPVVGETPPSGGDGLGYADPHGTPAPAAAPPWKPLPLPSEPPAPSLRAAPQRWTPLSTQGG